MLDLHKPIEWRWPVVDNGGQRQHETGVACAECTGPDEEPRPYPCDTVTTIAQQIAELDHDTNPPERP